MAVPDKPLKRLAPVQTLANVGYSAAATGVHLGLFFYNKAKSFAPAALVPTLQRAEDAVSSNLSPVVARAQDLSNDLLHAADDEVEILIASLYKRASKVKSVAKSSSADASHTAQSVAGATWLTLWDAVTVANHSLQAVVGATYLTARDITQYASNTHVARAVIELAYAGLAKAQEASDPDAAVKMVQDVWVRLSSYPLIARVLNVTEPISSRGLQLFKFAHDNLVSNRLYKTAVDATGNTLNYAKTTTPYKIGAQTIWPVVQPVAEPAIDKITNSKVVNQTVEFWKPVVI